MSASGGWESTTLKAIRWRAVFRGRVRPPRVVQRLRTRPRGSGPRPGPSFAGAGGDRRAAGGHSPVVPVRLPCGGRRRRLSLGAGLLGLLTACWVRAELDDRMRLNNWSIAASYDTARIFAGLGFGSSTASRSIAAADVPVRLRLHGCWPSGRLIPPNGDRLADLE